VTSFVSYFTALHTAQIWSGYAMLHIRFGPAGAHLVWAIFYPSPISFLIS